MGLLWSLFLSLSLFFSFFLQDCHHVKTKTHWFQPTDDVMEQQLVFFNLWLGMSSVDRRAYAPATLSGCIWALLSVPGCLVIELLPGWQQGCSSSDLLVCCANASLMNEKYVSEPVSSS